MVQALQLAQKAPALLSNAPITAITAEGDGAVLIRLSQPHNALAAQLAHYSTLVLAPESYGADGKVQRIIGTGPYRISKLVPPQQVETEALASRLLFDGKRCTGVEFRHETFETGAGDLARQIIPTVYRAEADSATPRTRLARSA